MTRGPLPREGKPDSFPPGSYEMKELAIHSIFPTTIQFLDIDREFSAAETAFLLETQRCMQLSEGNFRSNDRRILDRDAMSILRGEILSAAQTYLHKVVRARPEVQPCITQSWLNITKFGQHHHRHAHPNSFISGVLYINANEATDRIYFFKDGYEQIQPVPTEWNRHNATSWYFAVKTGQIVLFPSRLSHMVETKDNDETRISLAFNIFLKGPIGDESALTALTL